ncbi:hypothetical protein D5086_008354 [Populus alba]|uniref:Uncharacterized protein n=1 Tax=Populus alba TaxID=43335 RepID=A0ACC4CFL9_POPAL
MRCLCFGAVDSMENQLYQSKKSELIFYNSELLAVIGLKLDVSVLFRSSSFDFLSCLFVAGYLITFLQLLC